MLMLPINNMHIYSVLSLMVSQVVHCRLAVAVINSLWPSFAIWHHGTLVQLTH